MTLILFNSPLALQHYSLFENRTKCLSLTSKWDLFYNIIHNTRHYVKNGKSKLQTPFPFTNDLYNMAIYSIHIMKQGKLQRWCTYGCVIVPQQTTQLIQTPKTLASCRRKIYCIACKYKTTQFTELTIHIITVKSYEVNHACTHRILHYTINSHVPCHPR